MFHEKFGRNVRDNVWIIAMYFIAAIFLLVFVFPYLYMLFSSFKPSKDVISVDPTFFPKTWSMENYAKLFSTSGIPLNFTNSLIAALASTLICLVLGLWPPTPSPVPKRRNSATCCLSWCSA